MCGNSDFDKFEAGHTNAVSESARRGLALFRGEAKCLTCHAGFNFTDENYHNVGVGMDKPNPDLGRYRVTKKEQDRGTFKTPTLRNVTASGPYFHDGSARTLAEVIQYYDKGGIKNPNLSKEMRKLNLTAQQKEDMVAFLASLSCPDLKVAAPALPR